MTQQEIAQNIIDLYQQVNCIKNGDCCGGGDTTIYDRDGIFGTERKGNLTDKLTFSSLDGTIERINFFESGQITRGIGVGITAPSENNKGINTLISGFSTGVYLEVVGEESQSCYSVLGRGSASIGVSATLRGNVQPLSQDESYAGKFYNRREGNGQSSIQVGLLGHSGNGASKSIGLVGSTTSNGIAGLVNEYLLEYSAGVRGVGVKPVASSVDFTEHTTIIGVYGSAIKRDASVKSIGVKGDIWSPDPPSSVSGLTVIGGEFSVNLDDNNGQFTGGNLMALNVPETDNFGTVVFGADSQSINKSMLEVTGLIEAVGSGSSFVLERTDGQRVQLQVDNSNNVTAALV